MHKKYDNNYYFEVRLEKNIILRLELKSELN